VLLDQLEFKVIKAQQVLLELQALMERLELQAQAEITGQLVQQESKVKLDQRVLLD
jgi:hypothetical protein